jgi:hypothetical protein
MPFDDAVDDVGEVSERVDVVELSGLHQRGNHRPVLGAGVGAASLVSG